MKLIKYKLSLLSSAAGAVKPSMQRRTSPRLTRETQRQLLIEMRATEPKGQSRSKQTKSPKPTPRRQYIFNLDLTAEQRWRPILYDFQLLLPPTIAHLQTQFKDLLPSITVRRTVDKLLKLARSRLYVFDELETIANLLNLPITDVLMVQLGYEVMLACTSSVTPWGQHFRTLDWPLEAMSQLNIQLNVTRGGKLVCRALTFPGYCGFLPGMVPGAFSIAVNH